MGKKILILDASVFISAIGWNGNVVRKSLKVALDDYKVLVPFQFLNEVGEFIQKAYDGKKKTKVFPNLFLAVLEQLVKDEKIKLAKVHRVLDLCRDKADNVYISLAIESHAEILLTSDSDLLGIKEKMFDFAGVKVLKPSEFLKLIEKDGNM
ncbi:MAG: putative toxin-antitoxin system toxin component, PIN family [Thermotogae bacterium]|nr:putative toxin-antitoxin system toxin component, PIN family [Thermotogota bacterium]